MPFELESNYKPRGDQSQAIAKLLKSIEAGNRLIGAGITASKGSAPVMIVGRTVLGLGAESMIVAVTTALAKWFKGKELSFAFGINLLIARLASVAADNSPTWAHGVFFPQGDSGAPSWHGPLLIAAGAGVLSWVTSLIYWFL